ncbi:CAAX prenyl protease 1 [Elsinoe australis]|uniref:CAAX prenyl protease 1 n=1 Tax=Elsinoe australis TaxID=40998 RepID=A0A2P8AG09_9PEZI|nr:CAAX prenyl protease 1 [Elsinoe australis]
MAELAAGLGFGWSAVQNVFFVMDLADRIKPVVPEEAKTAVKIVLGSGSGTTTAGGPAPHVALWDDNGSRIGQYTPGKKDKIDQGSVKDIVIDHTQTVPKYSQADPQYVMVSLNSDDAICISVIAVANKKIDGTFLGDIGAKCGQTWFESENPVGNKDEKPKCVWLDGNHDNGINARALSFHLRDLAPVDAKLAQYKDNPDTLCKSTPRYSFWGDLLPNGIPPFFDPPLKYNDGNGGDVDLSLVLDDPNMPWDKSATMHPTKGPKRRMRRDGQALGKRNVSMNRDPSHLIISEHDNSDVRGICESETSYGWDIVSTKQKLFCDMEHKQLYPVCCEKVREKCFDVERRTLVGGLGVDKRDPEVARLRFERGYNSTAHWRM